MKTGTSRIRSNVRLLGMFMELSYERDLHYAEAGIIVIETHLVNAVAVSNTPPYNCARSHSDAGEVMSTLPLIFKKEGLVERHQIEGIDPSDRYFNRAIFVNRTSSGYTAKVTYEAFVVESGSHSTIAA